MTEEFARADWIAIVIETVALIRNPEHQRLGDRIARTRVVRKESVAALAWGTGQNTAPIVKCHSEGDSPSLLSSFHP
ncbi:MAG TPA: hypothetical protein VJ307_01760 [Candidatus Deferrimicrobiaceae bacterium]|nr:hypothetical protein [Candidatus Deferrimicrobiaceae bacterium]